MNRFPVLVALGTLLVAPTLALAEACTTLESLLPLPLDGWELFNDAPATISDSIAEVTYALILETDADGTVLNPEMAETASIRIDATPANVDGMKMLLQSGPMPGMLDNGPLGYPGFVGQFNTVVGDFHLTVDGNGPGAEAYYTLILGCALEAGLAHVATYGDAG